MNTCKICGSTEMTPLYKGPIRVGRFGNLSKDDQTVWGCGACLTGHLPPLMGQSAEYYQSKEYREEVDESADPAAYFKLHDGEQALNLSKIGSGSFRGKIVADVGCGGGSFLDGVRGYAAQAVAIEPSETFRASLNQRGYATYAYATDAAKDFKGKMDLVTSFSVIEHVEDPLTFMKDIRALLGPGGRAFISTPNSDDALLEALPDDYPQFYYRKAHLWYFKAESLRQLATLAGFDGVRVIPHHRFGLGNFLRWTKERAPKGNASYDFISGPMDAAWKAGLEETFRCDYMYAEFIVGN